MKKFLLWTIGLLGVAALSIGAFGLLSGPGGPLAAPISAQTPDQAPAVTIRRTPCSGQIDRVGPDCAGRSATVVLSVDGAVQEITAEAGDVVTAGDPLLRLDTADLELSVLLAELDVGDRTEFAGAAPAAGQRQRNRRTARRAGVRPEEAGGCAKAGHRGRTASRTPASPPPGPNTTTWKTSGRADHAGSEPAQNRDDAGSAAQLRQGEVGG